MPTRGIFGVAPDAGDAAISPTAHAMAATSLTDRAGRCRRPSRRGRSSRAGSAARARVPQLVRRARGDDDRVAGADLPLLLAQPHAPGAGGEVVDLLRGAVVVLHGLAARRDGRLGQRLVDRVARGDTGELTDARAVGG